MKPILNLIALCLGLFVAASCSDGWDATAPGGQDGHFTIELTRPAPFVVETRAAGDEETVESAAVFVFGAGGQKTNGFVEHSTGNVRYVDVYLNGIDETVYVVCNHPDPEALMKAVTSLADLQSQPLTVDAPEGAHPGHYVMTGHTTVAAVKNNDNQVPLYRLAARVNFTIRVDTNAEEGGDEGEFKHIEAYLCHLPRGCWLLDRHEDAAFLPEEGYTDDYTYAADPDAMRANYFEPVRLTCTEHADGTITASYDMFENRRGSVNDQPANWANNWPELVGLEGHKRYNNFKQMFKRTRALDYPAHIGEITIGPDDTDEELDQRPEVKEGRFYNATYLRIEGMYRRTDGSSYRTSYYVYLGKDGYSDFNVCRNYRYNHVVTIRAYDSFDHRVSGELLDGLAVYAPFDVEQDAHYNTIKALMYAPEAWTVSVKDPDQTPWLEVSHSSYYKPRIAGQLLTGDEAAFSISGTGGLNYFYVHTDEFIPELTDPWENQTRLQGVTRTGTIVCRSKNLTKEYTVTQLPAEIVILHMNYDVHTMKEVNDTFYVERHLEEKYMPWGFLGYWSYVTDDLIASGTWDGLSNTRKLYDVGLNGEYNKKGEQIFQPAYPGGLSYDEALGYVISKNRDRNGNGKIDYDEIEWYWPATKELEQIRKTKLKGQFLMPFEGWNEAFFASTPSSSDRDGYTPGFGVRVKMDDDESIWTPVQRDRKHNVIACRRKNAWMGHSTGTADGAVTKNPDWDQGTEIILPR